ncbi:MAG: hypothetical protein WKG01_04780 [Kofleriaceae bacterium]
MRRIALALSLLTIAIGVVVSLMMSPGPAHDAQGPVTEYRRPSGFWTSNRPATNGAYRYRLLGIGVALMGVTGLAMLMLIGKANTHRASAK